MVYLFSSDFAEVEPTETEVEPTETDDIKLYILIGGWVGILKRGDIMNRYKNLKNILKSRGMTQAELSKNIGVTQATISNFINNRQSTSLNVVILIADYLQTSIDYLVGRIDNDEF